MQLNMTTDYALRAVMYLASTRRVTTASEIADNMRIPRNYLINLISALRKAGMVGARAGLYGCYYLKRAPEELTLYDVICAVENTVKLCRCLDAGADCALRCERGCLVHETYLPIQEMMESALRAATIQDMLDGSGGAKVRALLGSGCARA